MKVNNQLKGKFPTIIVHRVIIFFFIMCFLAGFFYVMGTYQGYMDTTQLFLLGICAFSGLLLAFSSIIGLLIDLSYFVRKKKVRYVLNMILYFFSGIFGVLVAVASNFIMIITEGNVYPGAFF